MVGFVEVEVLQVLGEYDDWVADEEVREVCGELLVHAAGNEFLFDGFIDDEVRVEVFGAESRVLRDVGGVGGVAGLGDAPTVVFKGLKGGKYFWFGVRGNVKMYLQVLPVPLAFCSQPHYRSGSIERLYRLGSLYISVWQQSTQA